MKKPRLTVTDLTGLAPKEANFVIEYSRDFNGPRAATVSGFHPGKWADLLEKPHIDKALQQILSFRLESSHIDAEWVLMEAVDNHRLARQLGKISASNTALNMVAKHAAVDAYAAEKVEVASDRAVMERLLRARKRFRSNDNPDPDDEVSFF